MLARWFYNLLYGSVPAEFSSPFEQEEAISRLKQATQASMWGAMNKQAAVGSVSQMNVSLQRVIPMVRNSYKPFFVGRFELREGKTVLVGKFTMHWFTKVFMACWLGICVFLAIMSITGAMSEPGRMAWQTAPFILAMASFGLVLVRFGKWLSRNDIAWLSQVIQSALSGEPLGFNSEVQQ